MSIRTLFIPDHQRYEGVRPANVYLLRAIYFLMLAFVATDSWKTIITHEGPWDHVRAVAFCVWAAYPTMALFGLINPLRMLPIMIFAVAYKALWLAIVAYPLWRAGTLDGSPAEEMTYAFLWIWLPIVAIPWGYAFRNYARRPRLAQQASAFPAAA